MTSRDNTSGAGPMPVDDGPMRERLRANARLIERAQQALESITRTIDETRALVRRGASNQDPSAQSPGSRFDARAEQMLNHVVVDLIGIRAHETGVPANVTPTLRQAETVRRPGRYRPLV